MSNPRGLLPSLELKSPNSSRLPSSSLSGLPCTRLRPAQAYQGILLKQRPNLTLFCSGPSHGYTTFFRSSPMSLWLPARLVCPAPGPSLTSPSFPAPVTTLKVNPRAVKTGCLYSHCTQDVPAWFPPLLYSHISQIQGTWLSSLWPNKFGKHWLKCS